MNSVFFNAFNVLVFLLVACISVTYACPKNSNGEECSSYGTCQFGQCYCQTGYFGHDCSQAIIDTYGRQLLIAQIIFGVICLLKLIFALVGLYAVVSDKNGTIALLSNIRMYLFGIFTIISIVEVVYNGVDPLSQWGVFSPLVTSILYSLNYPLAIAAFVALLFHWIEVLNLSVASLNKEYMLKRISRNYKGQEVTLEAVVDKVSFLKKLQLPFLVLTAVAFVGIISLAFLENLTKFPKVFNTLKLIIMLVSFSFLSVGYITYGRRLARLMPSELTRKVKKLTAFCIWIVMAMVAFIIITAALKIDSARTYLILFCFGASIRILTELAFISIFLYTKPTFPFITFNLSADLELARERKMTKNFSFDITLNELTISVMDGHTNAISPVDSYSSGVSGTTLFSTIPE